jgi:hypothetical protein
VYGSVAKGTDRVGSDIDLMIISQALGHADVFEALQPAEDLLGRKVNPTVMTLGQWGARRSRPDSFVGRITRQPRIFVLGSEDDLE